MNTYSGFRKLGVEVKKGFTLVEVMLAIALIAIISSIVIFAMNIGGTVTGALETRADAELHQIHNALYMYYFESRRWPDDVARGLPNGIEFYLGPGEWPDAPFNDVSEYDWDNFVGSDGNPVLQVSVRFCPLDEPEACQFPNAEWAENFDYHSSYYWCIEGRCRAHPARPDDHPGHCANCSGEQ